MQKKHIIKTTFRYETKKMSQQETANLIKPTVNLLH